MLFTSGCSYPCLSAFFFLNLPGQEQDPAVPGWKERELQKAQISTNQFLLCNIHVFDDYHESQKVTSFSDWETMTVSICILLSTALIIRRIHLWWARTLIISGVQIWFGIWICRAQRCSECLNTSRHSCLEATPDQAKLTIRASPREL